MCGALIASLDGALAHMKGWLTCGSYEGMWLWLKRGKATCERERGLYGRARLAARRRRARVAVTKARKVTDKAPNVTSRPATLLVSCAWRDEPVRLGRRRTENRRDRCGLCMIAVQ